MNTNSQSLIVSLYTPNKFAIGAKDITINWSKNPSIIAPIKYIFENNPIWNIDLVSFLIFNEWINWVPLKTVKASVWAWVRICLGIADNETSAPP